MPLGRIARAGAVVHDGAKRLLHTILFALPSPDSDAAETHPTPTIRETKPSAAPDISVHDALSEVGPLSFAGSGYALVLLVVCLLIDRIHSIVQRPRAPPVIEQGNGWRGALGARIRRALTSQNAPAFVRIPGIVAVLRAWALFTVVTAQAAGVWPEELERRVATLAGRDGIAGVIGAVLASGGGSPIRWFVQSIAGGLDRLGAWGAGMEMSQVCWTIYICVCISLVCGAFGNGLDGIRQRDPATGFNLFGFSYLLHIYSAPLTHVDSKGRSRPDVHALIQLWIGLTELAWLQILQLSATMRRKLLYPTGVCGLLGLAHFVYVFSTAQLRFPSFTFFTHILALFTSTIVICTITVRALTLLFTVGHIPSPLWSNLLPHAGAIPSTEDDFGVALLKLGVACVAATQYSGLRNELASVQEAQPYVQLSVDRGEAFESQGSGLTHRIDDIRATQLKDPHKDDPLMHHVGLFGKACAGLARGVFWQVVLATKTGRATYRQIWRLYQGRWWYGPRLWRVWRREAWAAPPRNVQSEPPMLQVWAIASAASNVDNNEIEVDSDVEHYTYDQVLRGEVVLEDDEEDWASDDEAASTAAPSDDEDDTTTLYRDLARSPEPEEDIQPILLAHLTSSNSSPLTRRRYAAMLTSPPATPQRGSSSAITTALSPLHDLSLERRSATGEQRDEWDEERRRSCVVCMTSVRDVILWPCRCLLMCNDCRESLAARLRAKDHNCPNCRTKVDGYSRIYVP